MGVYHEEVMKVEREDAGGNVTIDTAVVTRAIGKSEEPDYVKVYVDGWRRSGGIPDRYRQLFLCLAMRMTYAKCDRVGAMDDGGQIVYVVGPDRKAILAECGWSRDDALCKGLKALVGCGALRKVSRGVYQVDPRYAARGKWHYNSREKQGGIKNLAESFALSEKKSDGPARASGESRVQAAARLGTVEEEIDRVDAVIRDVNDGGDTPF